MRRTILRGIGLAAALCALSPAMLRAQALYVTGRVVEAGTGEGIPGAEVRAVEGGRIAITDASGAFRLGPFVAGAHALRVTHVGYAAHDARAVAGSAISLELTPRPLDLDALVVTASRREQALADVPVPIELVSRAEIERSAAADVAAVLIEQTGVELQGGHPAGSGVMLQGLGSERVLVLMDGQPYVGRIAGVTDISRIPASMVERIEVVKGPQSTLHGSEAMGGVINIVTRAPDARGIAFAASALTGNRGRIDLAGRTAAGLGDVGVLGDFGWRSIALTPGQSGTAGALASRRDGLVRARWAPTPAASAELSLLGLDERQRWRSGQLWQFADNSQWAVRTSARLLAGDHRFEPTLYATGFEHLSRRATGDRPIAGTGDEESQRLFEAELLYGTTLFGALVDGGVEAKHERMESDRVTASTRDQTTIEGFVQPTLEWRDVTLVPGVRVSRSEVWGTHVTPRVALLFRPFDALALRVSAGEGFRAPDFKELYIEFLNTGASTGYVVRGNPELEPELSRNVSASVEWNGALVYARVQGFETRFERFIESIALPDSAGLLVYGYGNVDDGFTRGLELEAGMNRGPWRVELGGSLLRAERSDTGEPLLGRPRDSQRATLGWAHPFGVRVSATGVRTGRTPMSREGGTTLWRDAYARIDVRVAQTLPGGLELVAGADNALDTTVDQWPGFTGRHVYIGLSWLGGPGSFEGNE